MQSALSAETDLPMINGNVKSQGKRIRRDAVPSVAKRSSSAAEEKNTSRVGTF